jgi:hypothetical protein
MARMLEQLRRGELAGARSLDLSGSGLVTFPPEIFGLADTLESLDLGRNPLTSLPHDLGRLRRLRVLFCSGTSFPVLPPVLGDCPELSRIGFRASAVEIVPASSLPPKLRWLTLTDNRIEALPDAIGNRPALQKLMLSGNRIERLPETLAGAGSLELLRLSANRLTSLPPFLRGLPRLAWFAFAANPVEDLAPRTSQGPAVPWTSLHQGALLGEGASGRVHAASWNRPGQVAERIALKLYKGSMTSDGLPEREMEAALAVGAHPNILGGFGRVDDHPSGSPCLLLPLIPSHWRILAAPPSLETCSRDIYDPSMVLPSGAAYRISRAVAAAGAHLAASGLLHGDLYAHNIHWDGDRGDAMLGDFGAASRYPKGPAGVALEALDVLAWGILTGELLDRMPDEEFDYTLDQLRRAAIAPDVATRPSFAEILREMPVISG